MLADIANDIWKNVKADSHELCLIHAAVADGCAPAEIGNFYFSTPHTSAASNAACLNEPLILVSTGIVTYRRKKRKNGDKYSE